MLKSFPDTPIEFLKGVGPQRAELLQKELNIFTFNDLLNHFPFRYVDRTKFYKINQIHYDSSYIQLKGTISDISIIGAKQHQRMIGYVKDDTGILELVWFKGFKWIKSTILPNTEYVVFGKPSYFKGKINIIHPELEPLTNQNNLQTPFLQPVYSSSERLKSKGMTSKGIEKLIRFLLNNSALKIEENMPEYILSKQKLINRHEAITQIHFPVDFKSLEQAQTRLKFEELFFIQLKILILKNNRIHKSVGFYLSQLSGFFNTFYNECLPFELTNAQKKVLKEIRADVVSGKQMNRLLQGDVGCGKTIVALMSILMAIDNNYQACLMVPTEILAQQHFDSINSLTEKLNIHVSLLTGSTPKKKKKKILEQLLSGEIKILIGTHALINESVQYKNLGLVVIDEQHKFGVAQRAGLWSKNTQPPHILVMTATPIPRTLAMTLYGDLDISVIDELPGGRKPIKTAHRTDSHRLSVFGFMKEQIKLGRQIYVVYPLIKESEKLDYKDLMDGYESICRAFPQPQYQISILHGQMKPQNKEFEIQRFIKGETQIMLATNVIEVGVNIPNATVIVIESSERFGISQLHQLRGRVGRGGEQSYCILMTGNHLSQDSKSRVQAMVNTNNGFELSEMDLKLRGPGDMEGTQQSGVLELKIADLIKDTPLLQEARLLASNILTDDSQLKKTENLPLIKQINFLNRRNINWRKIS